MSSLHPYCLTAALVLLSACAPLNAQQGNGSGPAPAAPLPGLAGSTAFCLFPLPADNGNLKFINLGIVQYVELRGDELRLAYGGGNLGAGHEARIPVRNRDEALAVLARLRQTANDCIRPPRSEP